MTDKAVNQLINTHKNLTHSENMKVNSHVQREQDDWIINTLTFSNVSAPFKYKRKKHYQSLTGQRVNITYYPSVEQVAGMAIEVMKIVRIKVA